MFERLLIRYPLFELLDADVLNRLLADSVTVEFEMGELLFQEDTVGAWVHVLLEGRVRVLRRAESGRDVSLGIVRAGELFGEYALLAPHRHTATCRAASGCRVLRLPLRLVRAELAAAGIDGRLLKPFIRLHASMHFLTNRHYLGFMSAPSALTYAGLLKPEHFRGMRTLCGPGLAKDRWFYITDGSAVLSDRHGRSLELGPGDCFGSLCLTGRDSEETVSTLSELECLSLAADHFLKGPQSADSGDLHLAQEMDGSQQSLLTRHVPVSKFPFVPQYDESDCGLAALAMVAEFHELSNRDLILRAAPELPSHGLSLLQLRDLARSLSLPAEAYRIDPEHLCDVTCPFIAHLNDGHFVVVFRANDHSVLIADPASSLHSITDERLKDLWSGYVLKITIPREHAASR